MLAKHQCIIDFYVELYKLPYPLLYLGTKESRPPVVKIGDGFLPQIGKRCPGSALPLGCVQNTGFLSGYRKPVFLLRPGSQYVPYPPSLVSEVRDYEASIRPELSPNDCMDACATSTACSRSFEWAVSLVHTQYFPERPAMDKHAHQHTPHKPQTVSSFSCDQFPYRIEVGLSENSRR